MDGGNAIELPGAILVHVGVATVQLINLGPDCPYEPDHPDEPDHPADLLEIQASVHP